MILSYVNISVAVHGLKFVGELIFECVVKSCFITTEFTENTEDIFIFYIVISVLSVFSVVNSTFFESINFNYL